MTRPLPIRLTFDQWWTLNPESGCHEWQRSLTSKGYGQLFGGPQSSRPIHAHRFAWEREHGVIPDGMHVLHRCDNRRCVNTEHLFLGTNADNIADRMAKNRSVGPSLKCEMHPMAKLNWQTVKEIRALYAAGGVSQRAVAKRYGLTQGHVGQILRCEVWKADENDPKNRSGYVKPRPKARVYPRDSFDSYWKLDTVSGCWTWQLSLNQFGHGKIRTKNGRRIGAHRFSYERVHGRVPDELFVRHKCDNPSCVNPAHLELGTVQDNNLDMVLRGRCRGAVGERNSHAKVNAYIAEEIRNLSSCGLDRSVLAKEYRLTYQQVRNIATGKHWREAAV